MNLSHEVFAFLKILHFLVYNSLDAMFMLAVKDDEPKHHPMGAII